MQTSDAVSQVLANQIQTLDEVKKTCAAVPDLVEKAQAEAYRSKQILQLLSSFPTYNADTARVLKGVENLERLAKGMEALILS